jgi:cardiolipin synthase
MMSVDSNRCEWLVAGDTVFPAMLAAIDAAQKSVRLEFYTINDCPLSQRFVQSLLGARARGATIKILVDGAGSYALPASFWNSLREAGAEIRVFNPLALKRFGIRNHRKLLVLDDNIAFVGGVNIDTCYEGDGITKGWCDLAIRVEGPLAAPLGSTFDEMFLQAEFQHKRFVRFFRSKTKRAINSASAHILLSGPGRGQSPFKQALSSDLKTAKDVKIVVAYFLPTWRLRHALGQVAKRGGSVQVVLAGKSDVLLSQLAGRSLYRRFLQAGVRIHEYQPQILHAKLIIIDNIVYVGSSNLDQRSLTINYEIMVRFENKAMADEARSIFANLTKNSSEIHLAKWRQGRTLWRRLKHRFAYWLLTRIDTYVARRQWKALPD